MKTHKYIVTALIVGAVITTATQKLSAQVSYELAPQSFSIALTLKSTAPGTFELDPETGKQIIDPETKKPIPAYEAMYSTLDKNGNPLKDSYQEASKVVTNKYGNAELLKELAEGNVLPDGVASGWTLLAVSTDEGYQIIARKKNQEDVPVEITMSPETGAYAATSKTETSYKYVAADESYVATASGSGGGTAEGLIYIDFNEISLVGAFSESYTEFRYYPDPMDKSYQEALDVSKGAKGTGLVGVIASQEGASFATGTASIGAGKAIKVAQPGF